MNEEEFKILLIKYQENTCTEAEKNQLEDWVTFGKFYGKNLSDEEMDISLLKVSKMLPLEKEKRTIKLWPRIAVAVAATAAVFAVIYFFVYKYADFDKTVLPIQYANDIAPGKNGATLTLSDGKVITLSGAKSGVVISASSLSYNDGTRIGASLSDGTSGADQVPMLTAATAKGRTYQFTLPDGTKVWLNAGSELRFPASFGGASERRVALKGEGYFAVKHDKKQPFKVYSDKQVVEDIGTEFNINSYTDEDGVRTTLVQGSARVYTLTKTANVVLKPNQQSFVSAAKNIDVKIVDPEAAIAWKNNEFMFESQSIEQVMRLLERWYNVEVVYQGQRPIKKFSGGVSRFNNASKVLQILEATGGAHFRIEGQKIYVKQ